METSSKPSFDSVIALPFCRLGLKFKRQILVSSEYLPLQQSLKTSDNPHVLDAGEQLKAYLKNSEYRFTIALETGGTDFQQAVWRQLQAIPSGEVMTYGELARRLGSSPRAVGNACRANPIPLIIPCHRVVAANGLGGFSGQISGWQTEIKRCLLRHEGLEF